MAGRKRAEPLDGVDRRPAVPDNPEEMLRADMTALAEFSNDFLCLDPGVVPGEVSPWMYPDVVSKEAERLLRARMDELRTVCWALRAVSDEGYGTSRGRDSKNMSRYLCKAERLLGQYSALDEVEAYGLRVPAECPLHREYAPILTDFVNQVGYGVRPERFLNHTEMKIFSATSYGSLTVGFFGFMGAATIVIRFERGRALVDCADVWGGIQDFDDSKKELTDQETSVLRSLLLLMKSRGDCTRVQSENCLDLGDLSARLELDGKAVVSCRAYGWPPADLGLLMDFIEYAFSTDAGKERLRREWAERDGDQEDIS